MRGHKFLEHTADVKVEAWGKDYAEAVEEAAMALMETLADLERIKKEEKVVKISERAPNVEEAVVFSLSDVLSESDIRQLLFYDCKVSKFEKKGNEWVVEMLLKGSEDRTAAKTSVKAVTFCQIGVEQEKNRVKIDVVFDI